MVKPVLGEKAPMSPIMSMSNEQWNEKCSKLESELAIAQKKVDERENALKNVANSLIQLAMGATQMSATMNNISQQIIQVIQPPTPPQQGSLPPNNKAN
jgi:response regulator of citrate/malate metabolism